MASRYRRIQSLALAALAAGCPMWLQSCMDPGIDIKDVTSNYIHDSDAGFDYITQVEFILVTGRSLPTGRLMTPSANVEKFFREEAECLLKPEKSSVEKSIPALSKFKIVKITQSIDREDSDEDRISYSIEVELKDGTRCQISQSVFTIDGKVFHFKPGFVKDF